MKLDNIHYNLSKLLSYNKQFNFVISAREAGKTTAVWNYAYKQLRVKGKTTLVIRRLISDITDTYISDIENVINKFQEPDKQIKLTFKKGSIKDGIVDVKITEDGSEPIPFFRVVAMSNPMSRIKSLMYPDLGLIVFDEFICNTRLGEKYVNDEAFKFKELYNTFQRESENLRCIFVGNPYSLYNPYFSWINVNTQKLYEGSFQTGDTWVVECYKLTDELKEFILSKNPLYKFDDSYTAYAFDGRSVNDEQIRLYNTLPENYELRYVFYIEHKKLCIYRNKQLDKDNWYWIGIDENYNSQRRDIMTFDYNTLIDGTILLNSEDKKSFRILKNAFRFRRILFKSIQESYLFEKIYDNI